MTASVSTRQHAPDVLAGLRAIEEDLARRGRLVPPTSRTRETSSSRRTRHQRPLWRRAVSTGTTVVILGACVYLWPARLGGGTNAVLVRGTSMEPKYHLNDVVIVREKDSYEVGDIVLFEIPDGEAKGMRIIHRLTGYYEDGTWKTQGDNRDTPDQFHLTDDHLLGSPVLHIPNGGMALMAARNTYVVAGFVGLTTMLYVWPRSDNAPADDEDQLPELRAVAAGAGPDPLPDVEEFDRIFAEIVAQLEAAPAMADAPSAAVPDVSADGDVDADAERWLADELAALGIQL